MGDTTPYDAVVLDLGLPQLSGMQVLKRWRSAGRAMPVLVLTARGAWTERVEGLNAGADDYLGKPFHAAEVIARLRALIRRASATTSPILRHGNISLDPSAGVVDVGGSPVALTALELKVLTYLMHRIGRITSQADLLDHVYGMDDIRDANTIEVYIGRLRRKLGRDLIQTVRGLGYRIG
jgi:DNA-binding response OmpR family regulator